MKDQSISYGKILIRLANYNASKAYNVTLAQFRKLTGTKVRIEDYHESFKREKQSIRRILRRIIIEDESRQKARKRYGDSCKEQGLPVPRTIMIGEPKQLSEYSDLQDYIEYYNFVCRSTLIIKGDGIEESKNYSGMKKISLRGLVAHCFFRYLKENSIEKRKHIYRCLYDNCGTYYISNRTSRLFCWKCASFNKLSREYHKDYSRKRDRVKLGKDYAVMLDETYLWYIRHHSRMTRDAAEKKARDYVLDQLADNKRIKIIENRLELEKYIQTVPLFKTKYEAILDEQYSLHLKNNMPTEEARNRAKEYGLSILEKDDILADVVKSRLKEYIKSRRKFR